MAAAKSGSQERGRGSSAASLPRTQSPAKTLALEDVGTPK